MTLFYAFNGDADGLCALQQMRLADPRDTRLVTGVKRDIKLLCRVQAAAGDEVTVLDVSLDQNRGDLARILDAGASVRYFDHHHAGVLPRHSSFEAHIEESAEVCTSILVDRYLAGAFHAWSIVASFGDNLRQLGARLAHAAGFDSATTTALERLGIYLNYNAYGNSVSDLCFDPEHLAGQLLPFRDPMEFVRASPAFEELGTLYDDDMDRARTLRPAREAPGATMLVLPDEAWARRVIGVLANELAQLQPECAIAILSPGPRDSYAVSVRVPAHRHLAADEFCRRFETGGGRKLAAGINHLPAADVARFAASFEAHFRAD